MKKNKNKNSISRYDILLIFILFIVFLMGTTLVNAVYGIASALWVFTAFWVGVITES